jgi:E3 ubiquitin-protein ligase MUL1
MAAHDDELYVALTRIALAGDGVVLGIGMTVLALRTWLKYRSHAKALKDVEETPLSRIADLRSLVDGSSEDLTRTSLHESNKVNSVQQMNETLEAKQFPFRMWRRLWPQEVSMKQDVLVMVRGKVQSKASVDSKDKNHDTGALTAQNVNEKAVYLERTQTCLYNEWRGIFGWSYEWRAILGWGSRKEQVTVSRRKLFIFSELLNLQDSVDRERIARMYCFAVI